ncbi:MAG: NUDIX domain-containing protein [Clostridia bacterium]|nr:NUDIX domain-containing protein [Clostridia bacterium]
MIVVKFYEKVDFERLTYAVTVAKHDGKWVLCKRPESDGYELPGGHIEEGEAPDAAAVRELFEETGAVDFDIRPVCIYSANEFDGDGREIGTETFGAVYFADVRSFIPLSHETEKIIFTDCDNIKWSYPHIHPDILAEVKRRGH